MRKSTFAAMMVAIVVAAPSLARDLTVLEPADAIAVSNDARGGVRARFAMTVRAAEQTSTAIYLNSDIDYKSPTNVTFQLTPSMAGRLKRMTGGPLGRLVGRRITVDGILNRVPIYLTDHGRAQSFLRTQYVVKLRREAQIVAVD